MCWAGDIALEEVLLAADRLRRIRGGQDLPAWGEPDPPAKGRSDRLTRPRPAAGEPARHVHPPAEVRANEDPPNQAPTPAVPASQDPMREDPARQDPAIQGPANQAPARDSSDEDPATQDPADENPPTHGLADEDPADQFTPTQDPLAQDPLAQDPLAQDPLGEDPLAEDSLAENPLAHYPLAQDPLAQDLLGEDPLAEDELRAAEAGVGQPMLSSEMEGHVRMPPGPSLAAWLGQAGPGQLDEAGLVNSITGWRKLTSWAQAQELAAVAELGRRRGVMDDPELDRDPVRKLSAEFAPNEIALALTLTPNSAEWWMSLAVSMARRLPATWSALSQGTVDLARAKLIDLWTTPLDDDLARAVERKVLVRAGRQTTGQLRASLQRAVISADPAAAERRRTEAEKNARVELSGEDSGTAALSGHFLPAAQASAAWARISGMAETMKGGRAGGGIDLLRAQVFVGLLLGTLPQPPDEAPPGNPDPPSPSPDGGSTLPEDGTDGPGAGQAGDPGSGPHEEPGPEVPPAGRSPDDHPPQDPKIGAPGMGAHQGAPDDQPWCWPPIPMPGEVPWADASSGQVKIRRPELTVSWRTLAGWWDEPGQLTRMGPITAAVARQLAAAAGPTCLWRVVVTDAGGQVMAVNRIRWPGRSRRESDHPPGTGSGPPSAGADPPRPGVPGPGLPGRGVVGRITVTVPVTLLGEPPPGTQAGLNTSPELAAGLRAILAAAAAIAREIARADADHGDGGNGGPCSHANAASGYRIPDRIRDLIEVRDQDCGFPICRRPASRCDLDHTVPYDQGGLTCRCNISSGCRHDHRMKGSTAWRLRQPRPGTLIWTAPSGLSWTVTPQPHVA